MPVVSTLSLVIIERLAIDGDEWMAFVAGRPDATPFHHPAWATAIAGCYGFEAFALAARRPGGHGLLGGLPVIELRSPLSRRRRWSSLPFTDVCPALVAPEEGQELATALDRFRAARGVAELAVGGAFPGVEGLVSSARVQHFLRLDSDPEAAARRFSPAVRRNIRAARSAGLVVRRGLDESAVTSGFYRLHVLTRRRLGLPPQPRRFFRALWRDVLARGVGHVTIVEAAGAPVAAAIFLDWNGVVIYKYGASDRAAWSLRPNNLLFAHEIEAACLRDCHTFHFGRTDLVDEGLRRFKLGWGAEEQPLVTIRFGTSGPADDPAPPAVLRAVVRRSPAFVARSLGEALYRFVA